MLIELLAVGAGLAAGWAAAWLAAIISNWLGAKGYWSKIATVGRSIQTSEDQHQFLRQYARLWPILLAIVAKKSCVALAGLLPVLITYVCLETAVSNFCQSLVPRMEFAPPQTLVVRNAALTQQLDAHNCSLANSPQWRGPAEISAQEGQFHSTDLIRKQAYAAGWPQRLLLGLLGFSMLVSAAPDHMELPWLLVCPSWNDNNVLWPYLNDWEFDFFVAVCLASIVGTLVTRWRS